jgi:DNA-binding response OmpR family regulator
MTQILLVEDDDKLAEILTGELQLEDFVVLRARDGVQAIELAKRDKPDLMILDIMLPKLSGYDVCRMLRKDGSLLPIIMLTARGQEAEKIIGLDMGADDYLAKPFSSLELLARIRALLRRHHRETKPSDQLQVDDLKVDFKRMQVKRGERTLDLTSKEFGVLQLLIARRGEVVTRRQFLEEVWGYEVMPSTRTVDNQILSLRQKLAGKNGDHDAYIITVHGEGYKFVR